jgi:hypothetical protein
MINYSQKEHPAWKAGALPTELHPQQVALGNQDNYTTTGDFRKMLHLVGYSAKLWGTQRSGLPRPRKPAAWEPPLLKLDGLPHVQDVHLWDGSPHCDKKRDICG